MKNGIRTDFDILYDELSILAESFSLTESYLRDLYYDIKQLDLNTWNYYNDRYIKIEDIHMLLPDEIKQEYCDALNEVIHKENGGCLSLAFYFDEVENKVKLLDTDFVCHDHHINLKELLPEEAKVISNQIVVTVQQHIYLHKVLKEACQKYIKTGAAYDTETVQVCIGAYKKVYQNNSTISSTELSNINSAVKAGNKNNARDFVFSQKALDNNKEIQRNIVGKIPDKRVYLFNGYQFANTFISDLSLDRCLNNGQPFNTVTAAGKEINRNKGRISQQAITNHKKILANDPNIGLSIAQRHDKDGNSTGEVYVPIFASDWELLNNTGD